MDHADYLSTKLLRLSDKDYWHVGDATRHTFISGDSGSGKSTASGATIRRALLKSGAGFLILVAKPEEADAVRKDCQMTGRLSSLIEVDGRNGHQFNFLRYEMARLGGDGINSVVECLLRVMEAARVASATPGKDGEQYWMDTTRMLLRHSLPVILAATGNVSIPEIIEFVRTAPRSPEEMRDKDWQRRSFFYRTLMQSEHRLRPDVGARVISYWLHEYSALDAKLRGSIVSSLTTTLDRFNHGWMARTFCADTTFVPELCNHGAIILLNMPALTLNEDGVIAQILFKFIWQRSMLTRNALAQAQRERLVVMWIDEYQSFATSSDPQFLSACRASMVATVLLTQSLPTLYASMPGEKARDKVDHLIGMCATKVVHATSCTHTARWAADMLGRTLHRRANRSVGENYGQNFGVNVGLSENWGESSGTSSSFGGSSQAGNSSSQWSVGSNRGSSSGGGSNWGRSRGTSTGHSSSQGWAEHMDNIIEPADLGRMLRTGGRANHGRVDGIWYQSGRIFDATGSNFLMAEFAQ